MSESVLAVKKIDFFGDTLYAAQNSDKSIWAPVKWICQGIGLSDDQMKRERKRINEDLVLKQGGSNLTLLTNGGKQSVLCIQIDYVPLWLAKINITPTMLFENPIVVQKLINYQLKAKDALAAAFVPQYLTPEEGLAFKTMKMLKEVQKNIEKALVTGNDPFVKCSDKAFKCAVNGGVRQISRRLNMPIGHVWGKLYDGKFEEPKAPGVKLDEIAHSPLKRMEILQDIINMMEYV
jgi:hypothetical protein